MYTASGADPSGYAPAVLGHEGAGIVEQVGEGVSDVAVGDHVVTLFSPQCRECVHCLSPKTNLCMARSEEHTSELQSREDIVCRLLLDNERIGHERWKDVCISMTGRAPTSTLFPYTTRVLSPAVIGHDGAGSFEQAGEGVSAVAVGARVVTLFSPQCRECVHCLSPKTNLCMAIRAEQNLGHLPDGTTRLSRDGEPIRHFMGTSTFAEYTVMPEIALAKVPTEAPLDRCALFACGLST